MKTKLFHITLLFIFSVAFTSCVVEDDVVSDFSELNEDEVMLDVVISSNSTKTRAFADPNVLNENEYAVSSVRLYVFNKVGSQYVFEQTKLFTESNILSKTESGCSVTIKTFNNNTKKIIVILNEPTRLTTTLNNYKTIKEINGIQFNMLDDYPCTLSNYNITGGIYSFFDSSVGDYVLPFYGESSDFVLINKPSNTITIPVKRAVARVDLYIANNDADNDYYFAGIYEHIQTSRRESVSKEYPNILLKNYNKSGMIAPIALLNPVVTDSPTSYGYHYLINIPLPPQPPRPPGGGIQISIPNSESDNLDNLMTSNNNAPTTSSSLTRDDNYIDEACKIKDTPTRICHIYVPEIGDVSGFSLQANSLQIQLSKISVKDVSTGEYLDDNVIDIPDFIKLEKFTKLERNKVYKIYCTIQDKKGVTVDVKISSWGVVDLGNKDLY